MINLRSQSLSTAKLEAPDCPQGGERDQVHGLYFWVLNAHLTCPILVLDLLL